MLTTTLYIYTPTPTYLVWDKMKFKFHLWPHGRGWTPPEATFTQNLTQRSAQLKIEQTLTQTFSAHGLNEGTQKEVERGSEEYKEVKIISLRVVGGRNNEEIVGQVEEERDKVPKGTDNVPLVSLPRNEPIVLHNFVDRRPRFNPGLLDQNHDVSAELGDQAGNADAQVDAQHVQLVGQVSGEGRLGTVAGSKRTKFCYTVVYIKVFIDH